MKKTLKKRAFISAIAMLIVSAIVLTSSTFAWFAMATQVNVDSMELNITSLDGIVFSANTTNWTTSLTSADFTNVQSSTQRYGAYADNHNNFPSKLAPVSSSCFTRGQYPTFYVASIDDKGILTSKKFTSDYSTTASDVGGAFVAFDLFIKLATNETVTWNCNLNVNEGDAEDALYAMRVAVVKVGIVAEKADAADIQAIKPKENSDTTMFEINNKKHIATAGVANGVAATTKPLAAELPSYNVGTEHIVTYVGAIRDVDCTYATDTTAKTFAAAPGVTKIRVYIWLEGQDCDCESAIAGSIMNCGLSFSIV